MVLGAGSTLFVSELLYELPGFMVWPPTLRSFVGRRYKNDRRSSFFSVLFQHLSSYPSNMAHFNINTAVSRGQQSHFSTLTGPRLLPQNYQFAPQSSSNVDTIRFDSKSQPGISMKFLLEAPVVDIARHMSGGFNNVKPRGKICLKIKVETFLLGVCYLLTRLTVDWLQYQWSSRIFFSRG